MFKCNPSLANYVDSFDFHQIDISEEDVSDGGSNDNEISDNDSDNEVHIDGRVYKHQPLQLYNEVLAFMRLCSKITCLYPSSFASRPFYQDLRNLREQGYLLRLNDLAIDHAVNYWGELPGYYDLISAIKNTAKSIYLNNQPDSRAKDRGITDSPSSLVFNDISSFIQLQELWLLMENYAHVHEVANFLSKCSDSLTELEVEFSGDPKVHAYAANLQQVKQLPNVKKLDVSTSAASSNQEIQYTTRKFPALQDLSICWQSIALSIVYAAGFFDYICRIPFLCINGGVLVSIDSFTEYTPQLLQCTELENLRIDTHLSQPSNNITDVLIEHISTTTAVASGEPRSSIVIQTARAKVPLGVMMTSRQKHIRTISISVTYRDHENTLNEKYLGTILNNSPSLNYICISGMAISQLDDIVVVTNNKRLNLEHFKMCNCLMDVDIFSRMPQRIECIRWFSLIGIDRIRTDDYTKELSLDLQMPFIKVGHLFLILCACVPRLSCAL